MTSDDRVKDLIKDLYSSDKSVRAESVSALVGCGNSAVFPLITLLDSPEWVIRYRAAEALGQIHNELGLNPLTKLLRDEKDHVRYMAAKGLGNYPQREVSMSLIPMLRDENEFVRRITAVSLSKIGGATAVMSLEKAILTESNERTKEAMIDAVEKLKGKC